MARRRVGVGSLMDRAWSGIHARIRENDRLFSTLLILERPFVPPPWNAPWFHPGASYFRNGSAAGWLWLGDDGRPLKVGGIAS
jgi:hypothetical protein